MLVQILPGTSPYDETDDTTLPVTASSVKSLGRIDGTDEDSLIKEFILEATLHAEKFTRRAFLNRTFTIKIDQVDDNTLTSSERMFGNQVDIYLPKGKIQSVTSLNVYDSSDVATAYTSYYLDTVNGRIVLKDGVYWQSAQRPIAAIEVVYVAGYGSLVTDIPFGIRSIIRKHALKLYENREGCEDLLRSIRKELRPYRIVRLTSYMGVNRYNPSINNMGNM